MPADSAAPVGRRGGFTIIELLAVVVIVGILAAVAVPSYQKLANRARAASILGDFRAVRSAAYQYQADHNAWPPDDYRGQFPESLRPYVEGVEFRGEDYLLDFENWDDLIGISVLTDNAGLEAALVEVVGSEDVLSFRLGNRYTFLIESRTP